MVRTVDVLGQLVSRRGGMVAAQVAGPVVDMKVDIGDAIAKGDTIAEINISDLVARRAVWQSEVQRAESLVATREAESTLARQASARLAKLNKTLTVDRASYDDARQNEVISASRLLEAQAAADSARANLKLAEVHLQHYRVTAPYNGIITSRLTEVGSYLRVGDSVVEMIGNGSLEITADIPVDRLAGLSPATEVEAIIGKQSVTASVRAIIPVENPRTRARAVRFSIDIDEAAGRFAVGQTVSVRVPVGPPGDILAVHKDAVVRRGSEAIVYVVADSVANPRSVQLGQAVGDRFEVLSGLADGDSVVVRGNERLRPGSKVITGEPRNLSDKAPPARAPGTRAADDKTASADIDAKPAKGADAASATSTN